MEIDEHQMSQLKKRAPRDMKTHLTRWMMTAVMCCLPMGAVPASAQDAPAEAAAITHGPMLGRLGQDSVGVWVRTSRPASFQVRYRPREGGSRSSATGTTQLRRDNTGWVQLTDLAPGTRYTYSVRVTGASADSVRSGTFRTLPSRASRRNAEHNPRGLFNFSFEHGSCNFQYRRGDSTHTMPAYQTMLRRHADDVDFQIMNGDFIYEARRGTSAEEWQKAHGVSDDNLPRVLRTMPDLAGVWANYKLYLDRGKYLSRWHRRVPAFFTFDDHEIYNDVKGTGTPGFRNRKAVYRDVGVQGWYDYLGWTNPVPDERNSIRSGTALLDAERGLLVDPAADFTAIDTATVPTLHVHWNDDHPAAGVYEIAEVVDEHRLRLRPPPSADADSLSYSIGRKNYFQFRVSNAAFLVLDTRGHRSLHDEAHADDPYGMLGRAQSRWLRRTMRESDADFFFVVSSVPFSVPHGSPKQPQKAETWTAFPEARERLLQSFEELDKPVFLLTGDLHNSMAINLGENIHEYISGPHNSPNHDLTKEGNRPPSGRFISAGRPVDIRWSSFWLGDTPGRFLQQPYYVVVQVNNVRNSPDADGDDRWVAYQQPQVVFQFYDGLTGKLAYAESVTIPTDE
jgi:phosphodiesterase/alkaline phosphatase D-like protein